MKALINTSCIYNINIDIEGAEDLGTPDIKQKMLAGFEYKIEAYGEKHGQFLTGDLKVEMTLFIPGMVTGREKQEERMVIRGSGSVNTDNGEFFVKGMVDPQAHLDPMHGEIVGELKGTINPKNDEFRISFDGGPENMVPSYKGHISVSKEKQHIGGKVIVSDTGKKTEKTYAAEIYMSKGLPVLVYEDEKNTTTLNLTKKTVKK